MTTQLTVVPTTMTSREIAELTGKRHDHVMRDIETQLTELLGAEGLPKFGDTYRNEQNGQEYRQYKLPKRECLIVVSGYSVELRARIIDRWQELETRTATFHNFLSGCSPRLIEEAFSSCLNIARLCGFVDNMALLSADTGTKTLTGMSALSIIGATHLLADERGKVYTPTDLGQIMNPPLTAIKFNQLLESFGLQKKEMGSWLPTDEAIGLFEWADTSKRHSNGTPVKQLRWFKTVLEHLTPSRQKEAA